MSWVRRNAVTIALAGALALAASSGFLASQAIGSTEQATRTVTVDVAGPGPPGPAGPTGPTGPQGPPGPAGIVCPQGFSEAEVVFIQQGRGPTTLFTCLKD